MASTSTNKQPLLVDRPLLVIKDTSGQLCGTLPPGTAVDPQTCAGVILVDCTKNDGAVVEYAWLTSREVTEESYEWDPGVVPPQPFPPTTIGDLEIDGDDTAVCGETKTYAVTYSGDADVSTFKYKWTVSGSASIDGLNNEATCKVMFTPDGLATVSVEVTSDDENVTDSPQTAELQVTVAVKEDTESRKLREEGGGEGGDGGDGGDGEDEWVDPNPPLILGYIVNFYLCPSNTVFNPATAYYITSAIGGINEGERTYITNFPEVTAPVACVGSIEAEGGEVKPTQFRSLYIPKGQCLWAAAVQQYTLDGTIDPAVFTPLVGVQGGYY